MRQSPRPSLSAARLQLPISGQSPSPQPTKHTPAPTPPRIAHILSAACTLLLAAFKHVPTVRPISHRLVESSNSGNPALSLREPSPTRQASPRMPTLTRACRRMRRVHSLAHSLIFRLKALAIELDVLSSSDFTHCLLRADPS